MPVRTHRGTVGAMGDILPLKADSLPQKEAQRSYDTLADAVNALILADVPPCVILYTIAEVARDFAHEVDPAAAMARLRNLQTYLQMLMDGTGRTRIRDS